MKPDLLADVRVENHGSIVLVRPETAKARRWIKKHVEFSQAQFHGEALVVEPRYLDHLIEGMGGDGLVVL